MKINNMPEYARNMWIVATFDGDELWFYGAYNNAERAGLVAEEINGWVIVQ